jgi:nucleoside-diphosphate-sugar epimerase
MRIFIFGLGHLSKFFVKEMVNETSKEFNIGGLWRTPKPGFENLARVDSYVADRDPFPEDLGDDYDWVVWSYPPLQNYKEILLKADQHFNPKTSWIFTSSTSVYSEGLVNETSPREGTKFRGANLVEIEDVLYQFNRNTNIVRPSGLVDSKRNPARFFSKDKEPYALKGEQTNLVHTKDVARFLKFIILNDIKGEDFNLASEVRYEKSEFYNKVRALKHLESVEFTDSEGLNSKTAEPKIIDSKKSRDAGFSYQYDDLLEFFTNQKSN